MDQRLRVTRAEIEYLIESELVELPVDLLVRRLRVSYQDIELCKKLLPLIVEIYGEVKKWPKERRLEEYKKNQ